MIREIYSSLGRHDAMLLMSSLFFGGADAVELYDFLPEERAEKLRAHAATLLEVPKKQRLSLLVREIRRMMSVRTTARLEGVDPSWLTAGFRGEKPHVIAIVLMHMPSSITKQIVQRLPPAIRQALPPRSELRGVPMDILKLVREKYDARFALMELPRSLKSFGFREVVALEARELIQLTRALGVEELACAFVSVGKRALAELLRRMPRENAEELIVAVKKVARHDAMELKTAQKFLGRVLVNFKNTDELFQKAGLYQLANALTLEDREFVRQLCQRFPRAHGRLLEEYLAKAKEFGGSEPEHVRRLQDRVLTQIKDLSSRGKINTKYLKSDFRFHEASVEAEDED